MKVELSNLSVGYGARVVQGGLCAGLQSGSMTCLLGANGSGKSTLLRTLSGMQPPLGGAILVDGKPLIELTDHERALTFAVVLTDRVLLERTTVRQLVALGRTPYIPWHGTMSDTDWQRVDKAIRLVGIEALADKQVNALSDGERQRVMIARALAQDTPLLLLDEPTSFLDLPNRIEIMRLLQQLAHQEGKIILVSTHELDIALHTADMIWLMRKDSPMVCAAPNEILQTDAIAAAFPSKLFHFDANDNSLKYDF